MTRATHPEHPLAIRFAEFTLHPGDRLERAGDVVKVEPQVLELLALLLEEPGELVSRERIFESLWPGVFVTDASLFQCIRKLRKVLGDDARAPRLVATVPRLGYRFVGEVLTAATAPRRAPSRPFYADRSFGREDERQRLARALDASRVVTLLGPGGIGKTRLATEVLTHEPGLVCRLGSCRTAADVAASVATSLGVQSGELGEGASLAAHLGDQLLVLDEAEGAAADVASLIAAWLPHCRTRFLVTTRVRLGLAAERVVELGALDRYAAMALYRDRARAVAPDASDDDAVVEALVERLDRWPLAIELAAARRRVLDPRALLARLERGPLVASRVDRSDRHGSMAASIAWSWSLLDDPARTAASTLAVFRSGFDLDQAEGLLGDAAADHIEVLRDHAWLVADGVRFAFPETLRAAAWDAATPEQAEDVEHRWVVLEGLRAERMRHAPTRLLYQERADWNEVLPRATDPLAIAALTEALRRSWYLSRPSHESQRLLEKSLARVAHHDGARSRILAMLARVQMSAPSLDDKRASLETAQRATALATTPHERAEAIRCEVFPLAIAGRNDEAVARAEEALEAFRALDDGVGVGRALRVLGMVRLRQGRAEEAREAVERSCRLLREGDAPAEEALSRLRAMAAGFFHQDLPAVQRHGLRTLELCDPHLDATVCGSALRRLGLVAVYERRFDDAEALMAQSAARVVPGAATEHVSAWGAQLAIARGDLDGARAWLERVDRDARKKGPLALAEHLEHWTHLELLSGNLDRAASLQQTRLVGYRHANSQSGVGACHTVLALVAAARGQVAQARAHADDARTALAELHAHIMDIYRQLLEVVVPLAAENAGDLAAAPAVDAGIEAVEAMDPSGVTVPRARAPDIDVFLRFIAQNRAARGA